MNKFMFFLMCSSIGTPPSNLSYLFVQSKRQTMFNYAVHVITIALNVHVSFFHTYFKSGLDHFSTKLGTESDLVLCTAVVFVTAAYNNTTGKS